MSGSPEPTGERPVYFEEAAGYVDTPVFRRSELGAGTELNGPAIVEERESTIVVGPAATITVDDQGNLTYTYG